MSPLGTAPRPDARWIAKTGISAMLKSERMISFAAPARCVSMKRRRPQVAGRPTLNNAPLDGGGDILTLASRHDQNLSASAGAR